MKNYLSLIKFSHTIFAMPFALIGFFLSLFSSGFILKDRYNSFVPDWYNTTGIISDLTVQDIMIKFLLVIGCMVFARSASMAFNRYLDRDIDALNPRTAIREIPRGIITPQNALLFTIINCL
ncbi:MAG: UbiA family prenyltransferase, partial [Bacteroidota bacterium]|nr:UbiA family prenyltransferase [Bacteroidota bacterium]